MEITAMFIYALGCPACVEYKRQFEQEIKRVLRLRGVSCIDYIAETIDGFPATSSPRFLHHFTFFPCVVLIETKVLLSSDKLSDMVCLAMSSAINGDFFVKGSGKSITHSPSKYPSTMEGYNAFVDDFIEARATERLILYGTVQRPTSPITRDQDFISKKKNAKAPSLSGRLANSVK